MSSNFFDHLPVELIYKIFDYLWAHEIFDAFFNVSEYLRAVLKSYDRFLINFQSVRKTQFDLTCRLIRPDQVVLLSLSDKNNTLDQCILFFSYFSIEQFVNLRSFEIDSFNEGTFERLRSLLQLKYLSSLHLPSRLWHSGALKTFIRSIVPRLRRLVTDDCFFEHSLDHLQHLILTRCHCTEIKHLFKNIRHIRSLKITLVDYGNPPWPTNVEILSELRQFSLRVDNGAMGITEIKNILHAMPCVKYLELDILCEIGLVDGHQWESIAINLIRFDFRFRVVRWSACDITKTNHLNSFRTPFWLEQKRWFVAHDNCKPLTIFTIPRFMPKDLEWPSNNTIEDCTTDIFKPNNYVEHLNLFPTKQSTQVENNFDLQPLIKDKPRLYSLNICNPLSFNILHDKVVYEQIRTLRFSFEQDQSSSSSSFNPEQICAAFPRLECLNISVESLQALCVFIDRLKYLSDAYFRFNFSIMKWCCWQRQRMTRQWFIRNSRRLSHDRYFTSAITDHSVRLWMSDKKESSSSSIFKRIIKWSNK
ncbi:unnamed protein product [Rotaria sordida]|uniref:F-box domain-containing protein n=1 Tax=Rotaria sordida TaxID=392033 RepID=A0A814XF22_9BILA|nr:unnamed protein product [Rotaria sordida]